MVVVMVLVLILVIVVVVVAAAALVAVMVVVMMVLVLIIVIIVVVMAAAALVAVMVVVMVLVLIIVIIVVVVTAAALVAVMVVMMVLVLVLVGEQLVDGQQEVRGFDGVEHLFRVQIVPGGGDDAGALVVFAQQGHGLFDAILAGGLGAAEDDGLSALDLVEEELAEVLQIDAALGHVGHGGAAGQRQVQLMGGVVHHPADVGQLAHAGGLDQDAVGMIGIDQLAEGLGEVAHQRAADAAGVQLGHLNARVLHEAAVDADLAVLVLQQNDLFIAECAAQQLFDQRGLARAEETGNNVYLCHFDHLSYDSLGFFRRLAGLNTCRTAAANSSPASAPALSMSMSVGKQVRSGASSSCSSLATASVAQIRKVVASARRRGSSAVSVMASRKPATAKMPAWASFRRRCSNCSASAPRSIHQPNRNRVSFSLSAPDASPDCPEKKKSTPIHAADASPKTAALFLL